MCLQQMALQAKILTKINYKNKNSVCFKSASKRVKPILRLYQPFCTNIAFLFWNNFPAYSALLINYAFQLFSTKTLSCGAPRGEVWAFF